MADLIKFGNTSNVIRFTLKDKTTGQGKTGFSESTPGLIISTMVDNETSPVTYTQADSTIESITTLGIFVTPTPTKCRFKEISAMSHPGLYEFQFDDARFTVIDAKKLIVSVNDAESSILDADYEIQLIRCDLLDAIRFGLTALPSVSSGLPGSVITSGTGVAQIDVSNGSVTLVDGAITEEKFAIPSDTSGTAAGILSMIQQLYYRFFGKSILDKGHNTLKTYLADNTTVRTTQTTNISESVDQIGAAS